MLTVATYLWGATALYTVADVERLRRDVAAHLPVAHEFVAITDDPKQFAGSGIRAVKLPDSRAIPGMFAARKLMTFHPDAARLIGERLLVMDLDVIVTGDLGAIAGRDEPLVLWRNPCRQPWEAQSRRALYNSSLVLLTAGCRPDIWTDAMAGRAEGFPGDQDWISARVGSDCAYWDDSDGVYRLARPDTPRSGVEAELPENARLVFFPGDEGKPWLPEVRRRAPWITDFMEVKS